MSLGDGYFSRQLVLEGIGSEGQERLSRSRVLVVGLGGTGCVVATDLALAGVGSITLVDRDVVAIANLHRQPVYTAADVGRSKAEVAREFIAARSPSVRIGFRAENIDEGNALDLLGDADLAVDCLDNIGARIALNAACVRKGKPLVHTGALGWDVSEGVFWPPTTACLECLFPPLPPDPLQGRPNYGPSCEEVGTLGAVTGLAASLGAIDAIQLLIGMLPGSIGTLKSWDGMRGELRSAAVNRRPDCGACGEGRPEQARERPPATRSPIQLCGGNEFYVANAFSPASFVAIRRRLGSRGTRRGESVVQVRVGAALTSLFRSGGILVNGVSSSEEALEAVNSLRLHHRSA